MGDHGLYLTAAGVGGALVVASYIATLDAIMSSTKTTEPDQLIRQIQKICQATVIVMSPLSGGDFATAYRVELDDGRIVFAKTHRDPPPGFFTTEANGLRWLAEPAVVNVARVLGVTDNAPACLVVEWIEPGDRVSSQNGLSTSSEVSFGLSLAQLHQVDAPSFGRQDCRTTGSQALPNDPCSTWPEFYADRRLRPLAERAAQANALPHATIDRLLRVADRLPDLASVDEPPARLHGDLWAGNRVIDRQGANWIIDPAAHGGHREFDLAMMRLFGGFSDDCFLAYNNVYPLSDGWQERVRLHQLAPLVVHAIKFGGGYVAGVEDALSAYI